jgi:hypothetical protein
MLKTRLSLSRINLFSREEHGRCDVEHLLRGCDHDLRLDDDGRRQIHLLLRQRGDSLIAETMLFVTEKMVATFGKMICESETMVFVTEKMVSAFDKMVSETEKMVFVTATIFSVTEKIFSEPGQLLPLLRLARRSILYMVFVTEKIFSMTGTMIPVTLTILSEASTMVSVIEAIFSVAGTMISTTGTICSVAGTMFSITMTIFSVVETMFFATGTIFSDTESIFSVPDTTFFATDKIFSVPQKTVGRWGRTEITLKVIPSGILVCNLTCDIKKGEQVSRCDGNQTSAFVQFLVVELPSRMTDCEDDDLPIVNAIHHSITLVLDFANILTAALWHNPALCWGFSQELHPRK